MTEPNIVPVPDRGLITLEEGCRLIAEARRLEVVLEVRDWAQDLVAAQRRRGCGAQVMNDGAEIKLRAERKVGELLAEMPKNEGNRFGGCTMQPPQTLAELGLEKTQAHRWQKIATAIPSERFEQHIAEIRQAGRELTTAGLLHLAHEIRRDGDKAKNAEARAAAAAAGRVAELPEGQAVWTGDFNDILPEKVPDDSVDLIFTDPPYDEESAPLYGQLARHAARVLKPGGSLVAYAGHHVLPQVLADMGQRLRYWWLLALKHQGPSARMLGKGVLVGWKPLVWFVKERRANREYLSDVLPTAPVDKTLHEWEQGLEEAEYVIRYLSPADGTVLDPLCGRGTTLEAAVRLGRIALGVEKDPERADVARERLAHADGRCA